MSSEITQAGAERLVDAVYKRAAADLVALYRARPSAKIRAGIRREEDWIRSDPYGILDDPDGVVRACQIRARMRGKAEAICGEGGGFCATETKIRHII